jgi:hypothetical protein
VLRSRDVSTQKNYLSTTKGLLISRFAGSLGDPFLKSRPFSSLLSVKVRFEEGKQTLYPLDEVI